MRAELKAQHGLSRDEGARVSKAVFAYFRWLGWLDERKPIQERIEQALELAERYAHQPESFTDAELIARAVPGWLPTVMTVTGALGSGASTGTQPLVAGAAGAGRSAGGKIG